MCKQTVPFQMITSTRVPIEFSYLATIKKDSLTCCINSRFIFQSVDGVMVYIPKNVPRNREELLAYLALKKGSSPEQRQTEELPSTKVHYEEAMAELHYTPEVQLLELLQQALMDNSTQLEILKPFNTLILHLLSSSNVQAPAELKAEFGLHDHYRQKRCLDLRNDPYSNSCRGMCGPRCLCLKSICGDCCWNQGCYEHDRCCEVKGYFHEYCRRVFKYNLNCNNYGAYPQCLY